VLESRPRDRKRNEPFETNTNLLGIRGLPRSNRHDPLPTGKQTSEQYSTGGDDE
jgi:hypothetical protein